jgi:D-apionolactonase
MSMLPLNSGPLSMLFDTETAFVRYVRLGGIEIVRTIFPAVRDHNWDTVPFAIDDFRLDQSSDSFHIAFTAKCHHHTVGFEWNTKILGDSAGQIQYAFSGTATSDFQRNRIGLCVLHPIKECAGRSCIIEHVDGSRTEGMFPRLVAPFQPFVDIRSISHEVIPGCNVKVILDGDTFEMEDHRNWIDASFKTYSTPLRIPFPVKLSVGDKVEQSVRVELVGEPSLEGCLVATDTVLSFNSSTAIKRPSIGCVVPCNVEFNGHVKQRLREMQLDHLRIDLDTSDDQLNAKLASAIQLCTDVNCKLEVAMHSVPNERRALASSLAAMATSQQSIARCLLYDREQKSTSSELVNQCVELTSRLQQTFPVVVGTDAYFTELNRFPPKAIPNQRVCFSMNPQVHAFDNQSLSECIEALDAVVESATQLTSSRLVISPITLRPRFNPNATQSMSKVEQLELAIDARQSQPFGAAWTIGVLSQLLPRNEIESLTLYESHGPRGLMDDQGNLYPIGEALKELLQASSALSVASSASLEVRAIGYRKHDDELLMMICNLSDHTKSIQITGCSAEVIALELRANSHIVINLS